MTILRGWRHDRGTFLGWTSNPSNPGVVTLHDNMGGHQNYNFESLQDALNNIKRSNTFETPEVRYTFETPEAKRSMIEMFEAGLRKFRDFRARTDPAGDLRRDEEVTRRGCKKKVVTESLHPLNKIILDRLMSLGFEVTTGDTGLNVQTDGALNMDRYGPDGWLNISAQRDGKYISYWNNHISGSVKTTSDFLHGFERGTLTLDPPLPVGKSPFAPAKHGIIKKALDKYKASINSDPAGDLRRDEEEGERHLGRGFGDTGDGGYTSPMWPHRRSWSR